MGKGNCIILFGAPIGDFPSAGFSSLRQGYSLRADPGGLGNMASHGYSVDQVLGSSEAQRLTALKVNLAIVTTQPGPD